MEEITIRRAISRADDDADRHRQSITCDLSVCDMALRDGNHDDLGIILRAALEHHCRWSSALARKRELEKLLGE